MVLTAQGDPAWVTPAFEQLARRGADPHRQGRARLARARVARTSRSPPSCATAAPPPAASASTRRCPSPSSTASPRRCRRRRLDQRHSRHRRLPHDQGRARDRPHAARQRDHRARPPRRVRLARAKGCRTPRRRPDGRGAPPARRRAAARWCSSAPTPPSRTAPPSPRPLAAGDVVLIDGGCHLHGYASDITRTAVFGAPPTDRQRKVWDLVRQAQDAAFRTSGRASSARPSTPRRAR